MASSTQCDTVEMPLSFQGHHACPVVLLPFRLPFLLLRNVWVVCADSRSSGIELLINTRGQVCLCFNEHRFLFKIDITSSLKKFLANIFITKKK